METSEANVSPRLLGCADAYYAVGLARRMPGLEVFAFDINPAAQQKCAELAVANGVAERATIAGEFRTEDFASYVDRRALVFLNAEGVEDDLLRPDETLC